MRQASFRRSQREAPGSERMPGSLGKSLLWYIGSSVIAVFSYLGVTAGAAQVLGIAEFGYFAIAYTAATVCGEIALIGVHRAGVREAARLTAGDIDGLSHLRSGVRAVCFLTLPAVGAVAALGTWVLLPGSTGRAELIIAVEVGALVILGGQQRLWANYLRGFGHIRFAGLLEGRSGGALVAVLQCLLILGVWWLAPQLGLAGVLGAAALGYVIPLLFAAHVVTRHWSKVAPTHGLVYALRHVIRRDWRLASARWGNAVSTNLELWMAGWLLTNVESSWFSAAQRLSAFIVIPLISIATVFSPAISRLSGGTDKQTMERLLRTGATATAAVAGLAAAPMLIAPGVTLEFLFGAPFTPASTSLVLLSLGYVVSVLTGLTGTVMIMSHQEGVQAKVVWVGVLARVALGVAAVNVFEVVGLAASSALVSAAATTFVWMHIRRRLGINTAPTLRPSPKLLRTTRG